MDGPVHRSGSPATRSLARITLAKRAFVPAALALAASPQAAEVIPARAPVRAVPGAAAPVTGARVLHGSGGGRATGPTAEWVGARGATSREVAGRPDASAAPW